MWVSSCECVSRFSCSCALDKRTIPPLHPVISHSTRKHNGLLMRERKSRRSASTTTTQSTLAAAMVPQQQTNNGSGNANSSRAESPATDINGLPVFGSLLVDRKSSTPYSDATQVRLISLFIRFCDWQVSNLSSAVCIPISTRVTFSLWVCLCVVSRHELGPMSLISYFLQFHYVLFTQRERIYFQKENNRDSDWRFSHL